MIWKGKYSLASFSSTKKKIIIRYTDVKLVSEFKIHRTLNMKKEELEQFILKYGEILMKFCKITTNDSELAWELYQDTMLRLVEHYKKLDRSKTSEV